MTKHRRQTWFQFQAARLRRYRWEVRAWWLESVLGQCRQCHERKPHHKFGCSYRKGAGVVLPAARSDTGSFRVDLPGPRRG